MKSKYEIIEVNQAEITVDVSLLSKNEEMFFNATQMASDYSKHPHEWLRKKDAQEYIKALSSITGLSRNSMIVTKTGSKYGGTWLHKKLAIAFARWLDPFFAVKLDLWVVNRLKKEADWQRKRLEAKTGFLPMTKAILNDHDPVKHYHFSNEADMINRIVLGMPAKKFKQQMGVENVRDAVTAAQLAELNDLQLINTGLIKIGMPFTERKEYLIKYHNQEMVLLDEVA